MALRKEDSANLRERYPIYIEVGMIVTLVLLITAFRVGWQPANEAEFVMPEQEVVDLEEVQQTEQQVQPPPPPRPPVPVEVPNDQVLEDIDLDLDATLDFEETLTETPPPPPPEPEEEEEQEVFIVVEQTPELIGGLAALQQKVEYPDFAKRAGIEGTVFVQFIVDEEGNVINPVVLRGPHELLNNEALRVIREAQFVPGKQRGEAVMVKMSLPVRFQLR